jgi:hypothetical protein
MAPFKDCTRQYRRILVTGIAMPGNDVTAFGKPFGLAVWATGLALPFHVLNLLYALPPAIVLFCELC